MAPGVTIDNTPDFDFTTPTKPTTTQRTLLLAPPSVSAHPEALTRVAEAYDRNATDIQMLDRLALGLVALPTATYDVVLLLTDVDGSRRESSRLLSREVMERIVPAIKVNGRLRSQDGSFGSTPGAEQTEAILAGLVKGDGQGMVKPDSAAGQTVKLSFGKKKANAAAVPANGVEAINTAKRKNEDMDDRVTGNGSMAYARPIRATPAGVGFVDSNDDFDGGFDDGSGYESDEVELPSQEELDRAERIDPDSLLTEEDRMKPLNIRMLCNTACRTHKANI
jgi:anamorsin